MRKQLHQYEELIDLLRHQPNSPAVNTLLESTFGPTSSSDGSTRSDHNCPSTVRELPVENLQMPDRLLETDQWDPLLQQLGSGDVSGLTGRRDRGSRSSCSRSFSSVESSALPVHLPDDSVMARLYLSFRDACRIFVEQGMS